MINSNRFRQSCLIVLFSSVLTILAGCQQELLDSPSFESRQQSYTGSISAPTNVSATQGGFREIVLTWTASQNARQYCIYRSDSSAGTFEKFAETSDETPSFTDKAEAGILRYYKVSAVDSRGNESSLSNLTFGSTLATPIITKITKDTSGTAVTVHWYGGSNCTEKTYLSQLCFEVLLYDTDGTTILRETVVSGTENSVTFSSLQANRQYYFVVKAYIKSAQDDGHIESSDMVNESTAHRLIPDAPEELSITKGVSQTGVVLSWKLPASVDVKSGLDYIPHPVYFKVFRKELSASDDAYEIISSYIGVVRGNESYENSGTLSAGEYRIDCANGTAVKAVSKKDEKDPYSEESILGTLITLTKPSDGDSAANAYYPEYITGTTITFTDTTADIGKQYSYRVQSYTDDNGTKLVTSDESYADESGWKITNPSLKTVADYTKAKNEDGTEKNEYESVKVSFKAVFEDFGIPYKYVLYETCDKRDNSTGDAAADNDTTPKELCKGDSADGISTFTRKYQTDANYFYYYTYELKILSADEITEYLTVKAPGTVLVVQDSNKQPEITNFTIKDGYTKYFILSWDYDERCAYTISWDNTDKKGNVTHDSLDLIITEDMLKNDKKTVEYKHSAENGDSRIYTLEANNGLKATDTLSAVHTLKIPEPKMKGISYDKIEVTWDADEMSDGNYTVTAYYKDSTQNIAAAENTTVVIDGTTVTCTIDKPDGYDRAAQSGSPVQFTVSTKSTTYTEEEKDDKTATASVAVCTLGPAAAGTTISGNDDKQIEVKWNEVQGAVGYKIFRTRYAVSESGWIPDSVDVYYKEAGTSGGLTVLDGTIDGTTCKSSPSTGYTLNDVYREPNEGEYEKDSDGNKKKDEFGNYICNSYAVSQSRLAWGIPYSYTVIPVLSEADFTGDIDADTKKFVLREGSKVLYTDISDFADTVKGAAYGYGLNLVAAKAVSGDRQKLNWDKPYQPLIPVVYRRAPVTGSEDEGVFDKKVEEFGVGVDTASVVIEAADRYSAFEYVVKYYPAGISPAAKITMRPSLLAELKKQKQDYSTPQGNRTEQNNKGYLLTLQGFYARICDDKTKPYYEQLGWEDWDYDERAVGPDSIIISVQNNNIDAEWYKFIEVTGAYANTNGSLAKLSDGITDVIIEPNQTNRIYVAPKGIVEGTKGTTDGMLKVLRDYKHNYTFKLYYGNGSDFVDCKTFYGDDSVKTAYREITDEELVRAATLAMAIGAKATGTGWNQGDGTKTYKNGNETVVSVSTSGGSFSTNLVHTLEYSNFTPVMTTKSGEKVTFLTISGNVTGETWTNTLSSGTSGNDRPPYEYHCYNTDKITVMPVNSDCKDLYSATIKFNWLNYESNYRVEDGVTKGIFILDSDGKTKKVFGNITPFPFNKTCGDWRKRDNIGFQQDNAEWQ